jgi:hypothetical protein
MLSREIVHKLTDDPEKPWAEYRRDKPLTQKQLANLLADFGIRSSDVHPRDDNHGKGYERSQFEEAWERYLPEPPVHPRNHASATRSGGTSDFRSARKNASKTDPRAKLSHGQRGLRGCADGTPENRPFHAHSQPTKRRFRYQPNMRAIEERVRKAVAWKRRQERAREDAHE